MNDTKSGSFLGTNTVAGAPFTEGFSGSIFPPTGWNYVNFNKNNTMARVNNVGGFGVNTGAVKMNNFSGAENISGQLDYLITPLIDMTANAATLTFSVAYGQYLASDDILRVKASSDCGLTWTTLYNKSGSVLATAPSSNMLFTPTSTQWRKEIIAMDAFAAQTQVLLLFETESNYGNHIYFDDIILEPFVGRNVDVANQGIDVWPNPAQNQFTIQVQNAGLQEISTEVFDLAGRKLLLQSRNEGNGKITFDVSNLETGIYILKVLGKDFSISRQVSVMR